MEDASLSRIGYKDRCQMDLNEKLETYLDEWLTSPNHGVKIRELWGIDGYVCVLNFLEYVRECEHAVKKEQANG